MLFKDSQMKVFVSLLVLFMYHLQLNLKRLLIYFISQTFSKLYKFLLQVVNFKWIWINFGYKITRKKVLIMTYELIQTNINFRV